MRQGRGFWSTGTITSLIGTGLSQVMVQRDGQISASFAVAQYVNPAVGDRVTLLLIGQQLYATGLIV